MGRGGGGRRGGGGSRSRSSHSSGSYLGSGVSAKSSSTKSASSEGEGSSKSSEWKPRVGGSGGSGGHSSQTTRTMQSQVIHTLGPSSKECKKAFGELRSCLEANGDRMSVCQWYLSEWKKCQQKNLQTTNGQAPPLEGGTAYRERGREPRSRGAHYPNSILQDRAPPSDERQVLAKEHLSRVKPMATRGGGSDAGVFFNTRIDEYSRDSYSGGGDAISSTAGTASSSASSRAAAAGNSSQRKEDDSYYFSTSSPPPPESSILSKKLPTPRTQSSSDANDESDSNKDTDQAIQTLARSSKTKEKPHRNSSTDDSTTATCLDLQMELRACLDANDNRESVCMWHFRMWQKCKTEQQELTTNMRSGAFGFSL